MAQSKIIDTHSHLYSRKFDADLAEVVERAQEALHAVFLPNIDMDSISAMHDLVERAPGFFYPMMGLHPCHVKEDFEQRLEQMYELLEKSTYYGIGETGLDLYWDETFFEQQKTSLVIQIGWAKEKGLPIILHARKALDHVIELIETHHDERLTGIFHCFDGDADQARRIAAIPGFKMGIGGVVTYKKSPLPEVLAQVNLKDLVLETDSPYLSPMPKRGKRNESSYTTFVAQKIAEIFEIDFEEVARITNQNAAEVFATATLGQTLLGSSN